MEFAEQIRRARNGDRDATDRLLLDWRPWMRNRARGLLGEGQAARVDSSDVVQIAMAEAFQNLRKFRGRSRGEWARWLQRILRGQAVRLRRHNAAEMRRTGREVDGSWSFQDGGQNPTSLVLKRERLEQLQSAVDQLPDLMREIVVRRIFEEQSFAEISQGIERSPNAVRRLWAQTIRHLAQQLPDRSEADLG
jgi:RNA polymerase sigma factor (sigma-70 family)